MISKLCSLCLTFCSLLMSISLVGYALSFFGQISHSTIVVALSLTFLNLLKSCKKKKKTGHFSKSFTLYLHKGSTLEHDVNRFSKLQFRATTFVFDLFLEFGHVTTLPITYWLDPDSYNHHYLLFPHFWVKNYRYFLFWTSTLDPECITQQYWPPLLIFFWFFLYFMPVVHLEMQMFPYLEVHIGPWNQCPPSIITNLSLIFSIFYCHFSSRKACFSIFGSVHWTLKQYPSITSNDNHPYFFLRFYRHFIDIFHAA